MKDTPNASDHRQEYRQAERDSFTYERWRADESSSSRYND